MGGRSVRLAQGSAAARLSARVDVLARLGNTYTTPQGKGPFGVSTHGARTQAETANQMKGTTNCPTQRGRGERSYRCFQAKLPEEALRRTQTTAVGFGRQSETDGLDFLNRILRDQHSTA